MANRHLEVKANKTDPNHPDERKAMAIEDKFDYIVARAREAFGRDPRGGGFSFVCRPDVMDQLVAEMKAARDRGVRVFELMQPVVVGYTHGDVVMWWCSDGKRVPVRVSLRAKGDEVWIVDDKMIPESQFPDRRVAAEIRMAAWKGEIRVVSVN